MSAKEWGQMANKARSMAKNLGMKSGAGFLRNGDIPFEVAYEVLIGRKPRIL